ncbi:AbrB/MazE/SpoVT family DNA-binding domain-containing protein [Candidatus Woesearchaeota archaeon]|nr:AbrB/MazE/SpoVT family DNA-binding domain-containing protein [Candidatus Woesearchaeota archaeon]
MAKLQFDERQFKLTLPKKVLEALGWEKGDRVLIEASSFAELRIKNTTLAERRRE